MNIAEKKEFIIEIKSKSKYEFCGLVCDVAPEVTAT